MHNELCDLLFQKEICNQVPTNTFIMLDVINIINVVLYTTNSNQF